MGTSSMYGGYSNSAGKGRNPLLPSDFDDSESSEFGQSSEELRSGDTLNKIPSKIVTWRDAKTAFSKIYSSKSPNLRGALSKYVKAFGGAKTASKTAKAGIRTAINLGNFISGASENGFKETLSELKINFENKSISEILNDLINILSPDPISKEDSVARKAMICTMEILFDDLQSNEFDLLSDESIDGDTLNYMLPLYIENYIYERILNDMGSRIECADLSSQEAIIKEKELKDCINAMVSKVFDNRDFTSHAITPEETESLYNQCYTIMEEII